jgi:predicted PurR-regulated permease PerM
MVFYKIVFFSNFVSSVRNYGFVVVLVGTFLARKDEVYDAIQFALQKGYKHIGN